MTNSDYNQKAKIISAKAQQHRLLFSQAAAFCKTAISTANTERRSAYNACISEYIKKHKHTDQAG